MVMDTGQMVFVFARLVLGTAAAFLAIMLWAKTRDVAWMLMVIGTIATYIDTIYSILDLFGIDGGLSLFIGSIPLAAIALPVLCAGFFIAAFLVMVIRKYRYH
jgi:hypothetical protein